MAQHTKWCQNPRCPEKKNSNQIRGTKGKKFYQSNKASGYGNGNFCTLNCQNDWWKEHGTRAVEHIGILRERKAMTAENSWQKRENYYTWQRENGEPRYYYRNICTNEQRPLTESQYNDSTYTLNTGE